ncbi:MAG TPA: cyclic nucleotide-binding domain-containing protein [Stellaceae bacterium]|jgi:CRP-like cAMP-binding protein|nr:cyclic nucleotide-binding domain-containing protein [Stellaceae bacterium]
MRKVLFLFGELRDHDVDWFARTGRSLRLTPGMFLMHQNQKDEYLYIVLEGELDISVNGIGKVAEIGSGEVVGEMSFVSDQLPSADVIANSPCRVLAIPREDLHAQIDEDADFGLRFFRALAVFLADRLRGTVQRLGRGAQDNAEGEPLVHELDGKLLDTVYVAGLRFERLIELVAAGRGG